MPGLDAVAVAISDRSQAAIAIDALNAGKDEKPLTRTVGEGPRIVQAARVQARDKYLKPGKLGKITPIVAVGHRSAQAAHPGNLSLLERRRIHFDSDREVVLPLRRRSR